MKRLKKIPIQIYLDPEQEKIVGLLSKSSGRSKAAIIRSCISKYIDNLPVEKDPALNIINLGMVPYAVIDKRYLWGVKFVF